MFFDKNFWDNLAEELRPLYIDYKRIEFYAWLSIDFHAIALLSDKKKNKLLDNFQDPPLKKPSWPRKDLGKAPQEDDFENIYERIIAIPTSDRIMQQIHKIKIIYDVGYYNTVISKLEDYQKKRHILDGFKALDDIGKQKHILEKRIEFLTLQLKFLYHPFATLPHNEWPKEFGEKPFDFTHHKKLPLIKGGLFHRLQAKQKSIDKLSVDIDHASAEHRELLGEGQSNIDVITREGRIEKNGRYMTNFPGENPAAIIAKLGQAYLSWNVADFQALLQDDHWWNKNTVYTFIDAVKEAYGNSQFACEPHDLMTTSEIRDIYQYGDALKERKEMFKNANKICRLMVSGDNETEAHYQVLIMDRKNNDIIIIEHSEMESLESTQNDRILTALNSVGWTNEWEDNKLYKWPVSGKKGKSKTPRLRWHIKHIRHHNSDLRNDCREAGDINQNNYSTPDCAALSFVVFLKHMSSTDLSFDPKKFEFGREGLNSIAIDPEGVRWDAIKKFRPLAISYLKNIYESQKAEHVAHNIFEPHDDTRMEYTYRLLSLSEENFKSVLMSHESKKCFCSDKFRETENYFIPSCCFRAYHADCYMHFIWLQLRKRKKAKRYFCFNCRNHEKIILGALDANSLHLKKVFELDPADFNTSEYNTNSKKLFNLFEDFAVYDEEFR